MTTIAETFIEQGREKGRQEMEQEVQKAHQEAQRAHQEVQKVRLEMVQELQRAYQEAQRAHQEAQASKRQGYPSPIVWGLELKFGKEGLRLFNEVQQIQETSLLSAIRAALKFVSDLGELRRIYQPALASS